MRRGHLMNLLQRMVLCFGRLLCNYNILRLLVFRRLQLDYLQLQANFNHVFEQQQAQGVVEGGRTTRSGGTKISEKMELIKNTA